VLSFNHWAAWYPLAAIPLFGEATVFYLLDHLTSNIMLPLGGFALALFAGWKLPARLLAEELGVGLRTARILQSLLRYIVPTCVAILALFPLWT
jgi:NSS family neurotransmitter:Na+ symporter